MSSDFVRAFSALPLSTDQLVSNDLSASGSLLSSDLHARNTDWQRLDAGEMGLLPGGGGPLQRPNQPTTAGGHASLTPDSWRGVPELLHEMLGPRVVANLRRQPQMYDEAASTAGHPPLQGVMAAGGGGANQLGAVHAKLLAGARKYAPPCVQAYAAAPFREGAAAGPRSNGQRTPASRRALGLETEWTDRVFQNTGPADNVREHAVLGQVTRMDRVDGLMPREDMHPDASMSGATGMLRDVDDEMARQAAVQSERVQAFHVQQASADPGLAATSHLTKPFFPVGYYHVPRGSVEAGYPMPRHARAFGPNVPMAVLDGLLSDDRPGSHPDKYPADAEHMRLAAQKTAADGVSPVAETLVGAAHGDVQAWLLVGAGLAAALALAQVMQAGLEGRDNPLMQFITAGRSRANRLGAGLL